MARKFQPPTKAALKSNREELVNEVENRVAEMCEIATLDTENRPLPDGSCTLTLGNVDYLAALVVISDKLTEVRHRISRLEKGEQDTDVLVGRMFARQDELEKQIGELGRRLDRFSAAMNKHVEDGHGGHNG